MTVRVEKLGADRLLGIAEEAGIQVLNLWQPTPEPVSAEPRASQARAGRRRSPRRAA